MQKIIKVDKRVVVMFEDGSYCEREDVSDELFSKILEAENDEEVFILMCPEYNHVIEEYNEIRLLYDIIGYSKLLTLKGESVYWEEVSGLSMPIELVKAVLEAEENEDSLKIETYRNFWTLMSLNPDDECRKNLFWFLNRNGITLSRQGFFIAYRNVDTTEEEGVYTDHHSHTFKIRIGEMVTMPREECDCNSSNECSQG